MIRGIGVDTVSIREVARYLEDEKLSTPFVSRTFTEAEISAADGRPNLAEYYAARFAVKEAVFKAIGHLTEEKVFDFRMVETMNTPDGCPYVNVTEKLAPILKAAEVDLLHLSITTEDDYATAFVIAENYDIRSFP